MRRIFTILLVNFSLLFLSVSPVLAKPRDPLNRFLAGGLAGGALIVLIYGVRAFNRLFKREEKSKAIGESDGARYSAGETFKTSEGKIYDESQSTHEPPPQSEKEQYSKTDDKFQEDFQPPPEQPSSRAQPHAMESIYAGFWHRFTAALIDSLIIAAGSTMISLPFLIAKGLSRTTSSTFWVVFDSIFFMLIGWLYCTLLESSTKRATIGKMAVGILVTDIDGNQISFGRANGRWWGKSISFLILGIGYIMAGFTRKKQALHDIMADTLVLARPEGIRTWLTTTTIGGLAVLLLVVIALTTLNRQPIRTTDYNQTASSPPSFLSKEQPTSTQPSSYTSAVEWYKKGHLLSSYGKYREAIDAYSRAIDLNPQYAEAYLSRAMAHDQLRDYIQAVRDYEKVIQLNPEDTRAIIAGTNLMGIYSELGNKKQILSSPTEKSSLTQPSSKKESDAVESNWYKKGYSLSNSHNYTEQDQLVAPASEFNNRGVECLRRGQYDEAIDNLTMAISKDRHSYSAYINRGRAYYEKKQYQAAINDFKDATTLAPPNDATPYNWCGVAYYKMEFYSQASFYFTEAISKSPNNPQLYVNRGHTYLKMGIMFRSYAISDFKKACQLGEGNACKMLKDIS